ncbi:RING/FYVE/PHD zinc finger superfamily protein [Zea mays]|uniref:RING/FYVE/PHD zinc finger superfamily protein n=2 Tax=Zea mays TaxID=4577 RepID=A0A1D6ITM3_MAIZE|nr:RING/FYVE/PHD zinc finger superfamily protein [Zea mays]
MKVANGLSLRKSNGRFKSKLMMELVKQWREHQANMRCMNLSKRNNNIYVGAEGANITSPNDSNIWPTSALVAKNSNPRYVLASKCASQPPTMWLENSLNTSSGFKCSKLSIVRNALPSKTPKASVSWKSKDDSNAIPRHLEQSHCKKTSRATRTHFKAMPNLIHKAKNVDTSNLNDGTSGSSWRGQSDSYKGEDINIGKECTKTSELLKSREASRKSNILVVDRKDPNKDEPDKVKGIQDEVMTKEEGVKGHTCEGRATCWSCLKQANTTKTNDAPNLGSLLVGNEHMQGLMSNLRDNSSHLFEKNHSRHQRDDPCEYRETNLKFPNRIQSVGGNGKTNDVTSRRKRLLLEEKASAHVQNDLTYGPMKRRRYIEANEDEEEQNDLTYGPMKRRRYIEANEDEEDYVGDHHPVHIEDATTELTPQDSISKHCVERQCYCCSKPIDIPRWRYSRCEVFFFTICFFLFCKQWNL